VDQAGGDIVVVAPDAGRVKVAERFSQALGADLAFVNKYRPKGQGPDTVMTYTDNGEILNMPYEFAGLNPNRLVLDSIEYHRVP